MFSEDSAEAIGVYLGPRSPLGIEIRTDPDIVVVDIVVVDVAIVVDVLRVVVVVVVRRTQPQHQ